MRKAMKENIMDVFKTIYEAHGIVKQYINDDKRENAYELLCDCQNTAVDLGNAIYEVEGDSFGGLHFFEEYCEVVYQTAMSKEIGGEEAQSLLDERLSAAEAAVAEAPVKLEIVFLPYKSSMWDSLESIWRAADADPDCNARVIPIPYYDRNPDHSFGTMHYEGKDFPDYVPITHYSEYDIESNHPDIIYIHNPYDGNNYVTSVAPEFYSNKLNKHTEHLVYVPYHITGYYGSLNTSFNNIAPAMYNADTFVVQSEKMKEYFVYGGIPANKIAVLGNPKTDFVRNGLEEVAISQSWIDILHSKKVILLNTSISTFLTTTNWTEVMNNLIDFFEKNNECVLIWRAHPLLRTTVASMRPQLLAEYDAVSERMERSNNIIVDTEPSANPALKVCDGMISDYSSLVMQLTLTGKPTLVTDGSEKKRDTVIVNFDYYSNYFTEDGYTVEGFIQMIIDGRDEKQEERLRYAENSIVNTDGSCGMKIHNEIKKAVEV